MAEVVVRRTLEVADVRRTLEEVDAFRRTLYVAEVKRNLEWMR